MSQYVIHDIIAGASGSFKQIMQGGWRPGNTPVYGWTSGGVDPSEIYSGKADPIADFTTADLAFVLGTVDPQAGLWVSSSGITFPFKARAAGATYASGTAHHAVTAGKCLFIPREISTSRDQESEDSPGVTVAMEAHVPSDDGADPFTVSNTASVASLAYGAQFGMGPVQIKLDGAASFTEIAATAVRIDPGIEVHKVWKNGLNFPVQVSIKRRKPVIEVTVEDLSTFDNLNCNLLTAVEVYFRRRDDGSDFEADDAGNHGKASFATGLAQPAEIQGSGAEDGSGVLRLYGKVLSWSAAASLP